MLVPENHLSMLVTCTQAVVVVVELRTFFTSSSRVQMQIIQGVRPDGRPGLLVSYH